MMADQGYGDGYIYDHDTPEGFSGQTYFPDEMVTKSKGRPQYYAPPERGFEREIAKRLSYWQTLRAKKGSK
jgi:putative ATPase